MVTSLAELLLYFLVVSLRCTKFQFVCLFLSCVCWSIWLRRNLYIFKPDEASGWDCLNNIKRLSWDCFQAFFCSPSLLSWEDWKVYLFRCFSLFFPYFSFSFVAFSSFVLYQGLTTPCTSHNAFLFIKKDQTT